MRANVLIERTVGMSILGGKAIGSGVILRIDRGDALIVTNRHVVDPDYATHNSNAEDRVSRLGRLTVRMLGQPDGEGQVIWMAPGTIDLRSSVRRVHLQRAARTPLGRKAGP